MSTSAEAYLDTVHACSPLYRMLLSHNSLTYVVGCRFGQNQELLALPDSREVIIMYNRVVKALIEYEVLWTASWLRSVYKTHSRICTPILYRDHTLGQAHSSRFYRNGESGMLMPML